MGETGKNNVPVLPGNENQLPADAKIFKMRDDIPDFDFHGSVDRILQCFNTAKIIDSVKIGSQYIVQVPAQFQEALESGEKWMMENAKNGTMWPTLMQKAENGKNEIVTPLSIKKEELLKGNPWQDIALHYHNLYMQQQVQELSRLLQKTLDKVNEIEQGQKADRIALLNSGKIQIMMALGHEDELDKKEELRLGRKSLYDGACQIFETLKLKVQNFKPVPKSQMGRFFRLFIDDSYQTDMNNKYQDIQEYYALYFHALQVLAGSFIAVGDSESARKIFEHGIEQIKTLDFSKVKTIAYFHTDNGVDKIYELAADYLKTEQQQFLEEAKPYDVIQFEISGEDLLEGLSNGEQS